MHNAMEITYFLSCLVKKDLRMGITCYINVAFLKTTWLRKKGGKNFSDKHYRFVPNKDIMSLFSGSCLLSCSAQYTD